MSICAFTESMKMYNFDFYGDKDHYEFVKHIYKYYHNRLSSRTRVYVPDTQSASDDEIIDSLKYRYPVYYGKPIVDKYNWDHIINLLGYNVTNIQKDPDIVYRRRYAISGPVKIMKSSLDSEYVEVVITHVCGVNLENSNTADYNVLVKSKPGVNFDEYFARMKELFKLIVSSSDHTMRSEHRNGADIQMPLIGAGCFLRALSTTDRNKCVIIIVRALFETINEMPKYISLKLCIYNPNEFESWLIPSLKAKVKNHDNFTIGVGSFHGNVLQNIQNPMKTGRSSIIINAADQSSFIGNGGTSDNSVDGMIVANAGGYNNSFRNSSYLHNTWFNPHLYHPESWIRL